MTAPLAGWGLLHISAAAAGAVRIGHSAPLALVAGAAPLALVLAVNLAVAWGSDFRVRTASVDLGRWIRAEYGPAARLLGPDGTAQVVNHYAEGICESFPETAPASAVASQIVRLNPNVVLFPTDCRESAIGRLSDCAAALGFEAVDRRRLPDGCDKLQVLERRGGDRPRG